MMKIFLLFVGALALVSAAPALREKRQAPPGMPMPPPGFPEMPMLNPELSQMAETLTRMTRQAPGLNGAAPPSSRVARQAINGEFEKPKHIRQEAFYSSITNIARKKRGSINQETAIRG